MRTLPPVKPPPFAVSLIVEDVYQAVGPLIRTSADHPPMPRFAPNWPPVAPTPPPASAAASTLKELAPVIGEITKVDTDNTIARLGICWVEILDTPEHVIMS